MGTGVFGNRGWELTVLLPDASTETREFVEATLTASSRLLHKITGGQMYFGKIYFTVYPEAMSSSDISFCADLDFPADKPISASSIRNGVGQLWQVMSIPMRKDVSDDPDGCCEMPGWDLPDERVARTAAIVVHEFGHYAFGLLDEYGMCRCLMACKGIAAFCDEEHNPAAAKGPSCWQRIADKYGLKRPSEAGYDHDPPPCPDVTWEDMAPQTQIVVTTNQASTRESQCAAKATAEAWRMIAQNSGVVVRHEVPTDTVDPLMAITAAMAGIGEVRKRGSGTILLVGASEPLLGVEPPGVNGSELKALLKRLVRGRGAAVNIISRTPVSREVREFALGSSGVVQVVTCPREMVPIDLRARAIARLGTSIDGWGMQYMHRLTARADDVYEINVHLEQDAYCAAFVLVRHADEHEDIDADNRVTIEVRSPSQQTYEVAATTDGSILVCHVPKPEYGLWQVRLVSEQGPAAKERYVTLIGLIDNPPVWIRSTQPRANGGNELMVFEMSHRLKTQDPAQAQRDKAERDAKMFDLQPPSPKWWWDAQSMAVDDFESLEPKPEEGYVDYRIDFDFRNPDPENGYDAPVTRVLPYQLYDEPKSSENG